MNRKIGDYSKEDIKENCVIEFLCSLKDKNTLSIKVIVEKIVNFFRG